MMFLTTPEPTVRPPSRNHFTVLFTILSLIFLVFQRFCLLKACGILVTLKFGAIWEPVHRTLNHIGFYVAFFVTFYSPLFIRHSQYDL